MRSAGPGCRSARESRDRFGLGAGVEDSASRSARERHGANVPWFIDKDVDGEGPPRAPPPGTRPPAFAL